MGLILLLVSILCGYCLVKTFLGLRNPLLLFVGAFLIGCLIAGPILYLLDLLFVATFRHYTLSNAVFLALASAYILWTFTRKNRLR